MNPLGGDQRPLRVCRKCCPRQHRVPRAPTLEMSALLDEPAFHRRSPRPQVRRPSSHSPKAIARQSRRWDSCAHALPQSTGLHPPRVQYSCKNIAILAKH
eukprot:1321410-Prymnesium_polylepis.1